MYDRGEKEARSRTTATVHALVLVEVVTAAEHLLTTGEIAFMRCQPQAVSRWSGLGCNSLTLLVGVETSDVSLEMLAAPEAASTALNHARIHPLPS